MGPREEWRQLAHKLSSDRKGDSWIDNRKVPECADCEDTWVEERQHFCDKHLRPTLWHFWPDIGPAWDYDFDEAERHYNTTVHSQNDDIDSTASQRLTGAWRHLYEVAGKFGDFGDGNGNCRLEELWSEVEEAGHRAQVPDLSREVDWLLLQGYTPWGAIDRLIKSAIPEYRRWYLGDFLLDVGACEICYSRYSDKVTLDPFTKEPEHYCRPCWYDYA